jgi:hypothetical protein
MNSFLFDPQAGEKINAIYLTASADYCIAPEGSVDMNFIGISRLLGKQMISLR